MLSLTELISWLQEVWLAGTFLYVGLQLLIRPEACAAVLTSLADRYQSRGLPIPMRDSTPAAPNTARVHRVLRCVGVGVVLSGLFRLPGVL